MRIVILGASSGLGRALAEGLGGPGDTVIGVSRGVPEPLPRPLAAGVAVEWLAADLSRPEEAAAALAAALTDPVDVLIANVGLWEREAFGPDYDFLADDPGMIARMVDVNVTATLLVLQRLLPRVLAAPRPQLVLTGSTSGLPNSGRPEVTFGASKHAITGIAEALREGFRDRRLAVTTLQLGFLNTADGLETPLAAAAADPGLIPLHDAVAMTRALLALSPASYVRSLVLPAIADPRF